MIIDVKGLSSSERGYKVGTHNGVFHSDEVVGMAILDIVYEDEGLHVVRTRDAEELGKCDIVIDVGGGSLDHHVAGFNLKRETGEMYATAGLVWKDFGIGAIGNVLMKMGVDIYVQDIYSIKAEIDSKFIIPVDLEDNGIKAETHIFSFIPSFVPSFTEKNPDYEKAFFKAETMACSILRKIIEKMIVKRFAKNIIVPLMKEEYHEYQTHSDRYLGIITLPSQTMPWLENVVKENDNMESCIKFVIFPYPDGGWAAQCVPPSLERKFEQLVPFPKEWAGLKNQELQEVSGIPQATLCHNGCFFARAISREGIIDMCRIALRESNDR
ncbi:MAG: MYG1 family protein [Clostridia bacterium]|nr:MYG1 family protein [Clostridia bacterium]